MRKTILLLLVLVFAVCAIEAQFPVGGPKGGRGGNVVRQRSALIRRARLASKVIWKAHLPSARRYVQGGVVLNVKGRNSPLVGRYRGARGVVNFMRKFKKQVYNPGKAKREPKVKKILVNLKRNFVDFQMTKAMLGPKGGKVIKNFAWTSRYRMGKGFLRSKVVGMSVFVHKGFKRIQGKKKGQPKKRPNKRRANLINRAKLASKFVWKAKVPLTKKYVKRTLRLRVRGPKGNDLVGIYRGAGGVVRFIRKFKKRIYNPGKAKREPKVRRIRVFMKKNRVDFHMTKALIGKNGKPIKNFSWVARYTMGKGKASRTKIVRMSVFVTKGFKRFVGKKKKGKPAPGSSRPSPKRKSPKRKPSPKRRGKKGRRGGKKKPVKGLSSPAVKKLFDSSHKASKFVWKANVPLAKKFVSKKVILNVRGPKGHDLTGIYRGAAGVCQFMRKFKKRIYNPGKKKRQPKVKHVKIFPAARRVEYTMRKAMNGPKGKIIKHFTWIAKYTMGRGKKSNRIVKMSVFVTRGFKTMSGKPKGPKQNLKARARLASKFVWKANLSLTRKYVSKKVILRVRGPKGNPLVGVYRGAGGVVQFIKKFKKRIYNPKKKKREPKTLKTNVLLKLNRVDFTMRKPMLGKKGKIVRRFQWIARYTMGKGKQAHKIVGMRVWVQKGFRSFVGKKKG